MNEGGKNVVYVFGTDGVLQEHVNGFYPWKGNVYWVENGIKNVEPGLRYVEGYYYYFKYETGGCHGQERHLLGRNNQWLDEAG